MPPITKVEQAKAREERLRRLKLYGYISAGVVGWGALGCVWLASSKSCAVTSPPIYRLSLLLSLLYLLALGCVALGLVGIALDYCLSGKLRMIVVFEQ